MKKIVLFVALFAFTTQGWAQDDDSLTALESATTETEPEVELQAASPARPPRPSRLPHRLPQQRLQRASRPSGAPKASTAKGFGPLALMPRRCSTWA